MRALRVSLVVLSLSWSHAHGFVDDFNDNALDPALWTISSAGFGPTIQEVNQRLEIFFPETSHDAPDWGVFGASYRSRCVLEGDFDMQVEYHLLQWPAASGVRVGLGSDGIAVVTRTGLGTASDSPGYPREVLTVDVQGQATLVPNSSISGHLRFVRSGAVWTGYHLLSGQWTEIGSGLGPTVSTPPEFVLNSPI